MKLHFFVIAFITFVTAEDYAISVLNVDNSKTFKIGNHRNTMSVRKLSMNTTFPGAAFEFAQPSTHADHQSVGQTIKIMENSNLWEGGLSSAVPLFEDHFKQKLELNLEKLPEGSYLFPSPWPSDYYATWLDGINFRWEGDDIPSTTERYAKAFNLNPITVMNDVSAYSGIDSLAAYKKECSTDQDCAELKDGSKCGIRRNKKSGYCIPEWYGICHSWAPASIMETEPKCPVVYNDVTFTVMDLKALLTFIYDRTGVETLFGGNRCYDSQKDRELDEYGRFKNFECRDLTAEFFHVMLTNIIGRFKSTFVTDIDATDQVWNQPVRGYQVLVKGDMTALEAAQLIHPSLTSYIFNTEATKFKYYKTRYSYVTEARSYYPLGAENSVLDQFTKEVDLEYILELDNEDNIVGGEWVNESKIHHPDFLWVPMNNPVGTTAVAGIEFEKVKTLLKMSISSYKNGACPGE